MRKLVVALISLLLTAFIGWKIFSYEGSSTESQKMTWNVDYENTSTAQGLTGDAQNSLHFSIKGQMTLETEQASDGSRRELVQWSLPSPTVSQGSNDQADFAQRLAEALKKITVIQRAADGRIQTLNTPQNDAERIASSMNLEIISMLRLPADASKVSASSSNEADAFGTYSVVFAKENNGLHKSQKIYSNSKKASDIVRPNQQKGQAEADLDLHFEGVKGQDFAAADGQQTIRVMLQQQALFLSQSRIKLQRAESQAAKISWNPSTQKMSSLKAFSEGQSRAPASTESWDQLQSSLDKIESLGDIREETDLVRKVRDYLQSHPKDAPKVISYLDRFPTGSKAYLAVIRMLTDSENAEIQNAYLEKIRANSEGKKDFVILLATLAEFPDSSPVLLQMLDDFSKDPREDVRSTAILARGAIANRWADDRRGEEFLKAMAQKLDATQDLSEQSTIWGALGNAGLPETLDLVKSRYESSSPAIRHRLLNALRFVEGSEAAGFLTQALLKESDEDIRATGAEALLYRKPNPQLIEDLKTALEKEKSDKVQSPLLSYLLYNRDFAPSIEAFVQDYMEKHGESQAVRALQARLPTR